jgi:peptidoglycan/LPS O-acetylase OafA/YrhL
MAPGRPRARIELSRHRKEKTMNQTPTRRHDLDVLRILAVLLLIPFHSARVFDSFDPFYVKNEQTSDALSWAIVAFLNPWHMPLLFVLAGAATWFALRHRSPRAYAGERVKRLLVPFLFGIAVIVPPQAYLALLHRGADLTLGSFLGDYWTVEGDLSGYTGSFTPAHLWFIGFLFIFSIVALPLFARLRRRPIGARWLLFAMPLILAASNSLPAPFDGPQNPWYSISLFIGGFLLVADGRAERIVHRSWKGLGIGAVATMATVLYMNASGIVDGWAEGSLIYNASEIFAEVNTWVWVLALLGAARAFLNVDNRTTRYAGEASYPFYLLHQTVIIAVAYVVVGWDLGVWPSFATVVVASFGLTLALYEIGVRRTRVTRFLFGMKPRSRERTDTAQEPGPERVLEPAGAR